MFIVKSGHSRPFNEAVDGFTAYMKEKRHVDIVDNELNMQEDNLKIIENINKQKPSIILTLGTSASKLIKKHISNIPIIFALIVDPVHIGLIKELSVPEDNISGVSLMFPAHKQLKAIKDICDMCKRIGVLYNPINSSRLISEAESVIKGLDLKLIKQEILSSDEVSKGFQFLLPQIDLLWLIPDATVLTWDNREYLLKKSVINRLPLFGLSKPYVKKGALLALNIDYRDIGRQAAGIVIKYMTGSRRIPVESPEKTHVVVNSNILSTIGLHITVDVLKGVEILKN